MYNIHKATKRNGYSENNIEEENWKNLGGKSKESNGLQRYASIFLSLRERKEEELRKNKSKSTWKYNVNTVSRKSEWWSGRVETKITG